MREIKFRIWDNEKNKFWYSGLPNEQLEFYNDEVNIRKFVEGQETVLVKVKLPFGKDKKISV